MSTEPYSREDIGALMLAVQQLCAARDMDLVVDIVRRSARSLIGADGATFVLREGERVFYAGEDAIGPLWQGQRFAADECISGWVMVNRQSATIADIAADARISQATYRSTFVRSLAMVPVNREEPIAAIGAYWATLHVTSERELELLQALADSAATAISNSISYQGLRAARSELEDASTRLHLALDAGAIGTWDYDPRSGVLRWDRKCRELFGVAPDANVDFPAFLRRLHPDDREAVQVAVDAALANRDAGHYDGQYRSLSPAADGGERWIAARGQVQFDRDGLAERFVGTVRDISDQKLAEAEKAELLRRANAANLAKDEFLAMLGHELRNPLAPIVTAIELLKLRGHAGTREVASIERQSQHLVRLVDDLLDIARVTRGKLELKRRRVQLQTIVSKAIEIAAPLIERRRHVLDVAIERDVAIDGDEFRLAQLLANLLTNAAKYTPDSGSIRVEAHTQGAQLCLCVRDSGCGIAPELLPRLFAPFVQEVQSSARSQGGLGLGLALARSLAELHGGTIEAHSAGPGQGSAFTVFLPILAGSAARETLPPTAAGPIKPSRALEILVVDDNADAAELLAVSLRNRGHRVEVALDPVEALAAVGRSIPDLAFLDIGLPVMDGYELAEHLREQLGESCPVLIAITGYGQERDRRRSAEAGFALHLVKPVQLATVIEAVTQVAPRVERALS
jgi:PAS domain S-box-containing protein